jgi:hypothetical protein
MKRLILPALLFALCLSAFSQGPAKTKSKDPFDRLAFLYGDWIGEGTGDSGSGSGGFTIKPSLDDRVLVRTNYANYPATSDRPAFRHDDLMITYPEGDGLKAIYFDNEGHVIHYKVSTTADAAIFVSEGPGSGFRLTYRLTDKDHLGIKFEIAPPDKPGEFKTYIDARAKRL